MSSHVIISYPDDYDLKSMLKRESRRTGKTQSLIIREAFDEYKSRRSMASIDDYTEQDPSPIINLPDSDDAISGMARAVVKRVGWERGRAVAENLHEMAEVLEGAARDATPSGMVIRGGGGMDRSPGVK